MILFSRLRHSWGFALIIAVALLGFVTTMTVVFIEKLYPYSRMVRNIEDSNIAYYNAITSIEATLFTMSGTHPWDGIPQSTAVTDTGYLMYMTTGSSIIPAPSKGNSPYNADWNIFSLGQPVQLVIPNGVDWWDPSMQFRFRIPPQFLSWVALADRAFQNNGSGYINWMFVYDTGAFYADTEVNTIPWTQIFISGWAVNNTPQFNFAADLSAVYGRYYVDSIFTGELEDYYNNAAYGPWINGANCAGYNCTLKLSIIRPLKLVNGKTIPYLEYQVEFPNSTILPLQFMTLQSYGYSRGYIRTRRIFVPQITTNTALDFTVFQ